VAGKRVIIGMGNDRMGDDGIGVYLVRRLEDELDNGSWIPADPDDLAIVAAGSDPVLAGACLMDVSDALVIDAAEMRGAPGDFRFFSQEDARIRGGGLIDSTHSMPLGQVLEIVRALGCPPRVKLMGIQVSDTTPGAGISQSVLARIPEMIEKIKEEVSSLP
jgi:hydrogenase maturation protease